MQHQPGEYSIDQHCLMLLSLALSASWRRARALIGFVSNFSTILSSQLTSTFLDWRRFSVKRRLALSFWYIVICHVAAWTYAWVIQEKYTASPPALDWTDSGLVEGFFVIVLWEWSRQSLQTWMCYFIATKSNSVSELGRFSGILRGQESFAQAVSYGLNTKKWHGGRVPLAVNTILLGNRFFVLVDYSFANTFFRIAAVSTYIALKHNVPVEAKDKVADSSDEAPTLETVVFGNDKQ